MSTAQLPWSTNESGQRIWDEEREHRLMISYPFPMRDGEVIANLRLPKYLTRVDAQRLKAALDTLARDE